MANIEEVLQRGEALSGKYSNDISVLASVPAQNTRDKTPRTPDHKLQSITIFAVTSAFVKSFVRDVDFTLQ